MNPRFQILLRDYLRQAGYETKRVSELSPDSVLGGAGRNQPNPIRLDASGDERIGDLSATTYYLNRADP